MQDLIDQHYDVTQRVTVNDNFIHQQNHQKQPMPDGAEKTESRFYQNEFRKWHYKLAGILLFCFVTTGLIINWLFVSL